MSALILRNPRGKPGAGESRPFAGSEGKLPPLPGARLGWQIALTYALISATWILFSDQLVGQFSPSLAIASELSMVKGWLFVLVTAAILGLSLGKYFSQIRDSASRLRESEERLQLAVAGSETGLWDTNLLSGELYCSPIWLRQIGLPADKSALTFEEWQARLHPDDRDGVLARLAAARAKPWPTYEAEYRFRHEDGSYRWMLAKGKVLLDEKGAAARMIGTHIDITQRKQQEQEHARLTRLHALLSQVNEAILRVGSAGEMFQEVCRATVEAGGFSMAWVGQVDLATRKVDPAAQFGDTGGYLDQIRVYADERPEGLGPTGLAIREGLTCVCNDIQADSATLPWREAAARQGFRSSAAFPIRRAGIVCGALNIYGAELDCFGEREQNLLAEVAADVSFALDYLDEEARRERAEAALQESEQRFRALADAAFEGIAFSEQGRCVDLNDQAANLLGGTRADFIGQPVLDLITPESGATAAEAWKNRPAGAEEYQLRRKDGHVIPVEVRDRRIEFGGRQLRATVIRDLTERKRAEAALRDSEARYRRLHESMMEAFVQVDTSGRIIDCNQSYLRMLGYTEAELRRLTYPELTPPKWHAFEAGIVAGQVMRRGYSEVYEKEYRAKDGRVFPVELRTFQLRDGAGQPAGMWALVRDITERRRQEEALHRLNRALRTICECNQAMARAASEAELLARIPRVPVELAGYRMAWVGRAEADAAKTVRVISQAGYDEGYLHEVDITWADTERGRGPGGTAIRTGKPAVIQNVQTAAEFAPWREEAIKRGYGSVISLPLVIEGRVFGALSIYAAEANAFDQAEVDTLSELALDLAFGIQSLRSREEQRRVEAALLRRNQQLQALSLAAQRVNTVLEFPAVMRQLVSSAAEITGAAGGAAGLVSRGEIVFTEYLNHGEFQPVDYRFGPGYGAPGWVMQTRAPYFTNDPVNDDHVVPEFRSRLGFFNLMDVPILSRTGEMLGCLEVHSKAAAPFDEQDVELLKGLAAGAAVALENARMLAERRAVETALRQSEAHYRALVETIPYGVQENDLSGAITFSNEAHARMHGTRPGTMIGRKIWDMIAAESAREETEAFLAYLVRERPAPSTYFSEDRTDDGRRVMVAVDWTYKYDERGQLVGFISIITDVTERHRMEAALRENERKYRELVQNANSIILRWDRQGRVTFLNEFGQSFFGYSESDLIGRHVVGSIVPEVDSTGEALGALMDELCRHPERFAQNCNENVRANGERVWVEWTNKVVYDPEGNVLEVLSIGTDITARRRAEEALKESEFQLRALAARLQIIREEERTRIAREVHDVLGQLLTGLKMDLSWLERRLGRLTDVPLRDMVTEKITASNRLADTMIETVQRIATELRPSILDNLGLPEAIQFETRQFQHRTQIECELGELPHGLKLDAEVATGVFRIFQEVLTNVARHARATWVRIRFQHQPGALRLEVRDNGRGITKAELRGVKSLGLLGMRERAMGLGGRLRIGGRGGKGTVVVLVVPLPGETAPPPAPVATGPQEPAA